MSKRLFLVLGLLAAITADSALSCYSAVAAKLRVSGNLPLTGPIAAFSGQYPDGFNMGMEDAAKKLHLASDSFKINFQDNGGKPSTAVSVFRKQQMDGFDAYISGTSEAAIAVAPQVEATNAPNLLVAFDPFLARAGKNRLRFLPNSKIEAPLFVKYAKQRKAKKVFIINLNSAYANSEFGDIVEPELKKAGIAYKHERFEFPEHDFKTIAYKAREVKPDLIMVCGYSVHLHPLLRDLRSAGLMKTDGSVIAVMDFVDLLYDKTPKAELRGIAFACPLFEVKGAVAGSEAWRTRYQKRYGRLPTYVAAYAYDTAQILGKTYSQFKKVDTASIRKALPYDGITGKINVDRDGDIVATITIAKLSPDGTVVEIE